MTDKLKEAVDEINETDMSDFVDKYIREMEAKKWRNAERFNSFLDYLITYVDTNKRVLSDSFYYEEEKCKPYTYREFENYLESLYDAINAYGHKNLVDNRFDVREDDYFTEKSYCVKIKEKFYRIELVSGQGSYVSFELINHSNIQSYVDYDLMMNNVKSPQYEKNLRRIIFTNLEQLVESLVEDGADKELVEKCIREY